jgi:adenosylcobinamide kinase/adenosylcobinamide-phosphate guanylyltransferase
VAALHGDASIGPAVLLDVTAPDGARLLYACDTGAPLPEATYSALAGRAFDVVLMEENNGDRPGFGEHLDLASFAAVLAELRRRGAVVATTRVAAVHLSHRNPPGDVLARRLKLMGAELLPDGAVIDTASGTVTRLTPGGPPTAPEVVSTPAPDTGLPDAGDTGLPDAGRQSPEGTTGVTATRPTPGGPPPAPAEVSTPAPDAGRPSPEDRTGVTATRPTPGEPPTTPVTMSMPATGSGQGTSQGATDVTVTRLIPGGSPRIISTVSTPPPGRHPGSTPGTRGVWTPAAVGPPHRVLITGGSRSGKSAEAERRFAAEPAVVYVATAGPVPPGDDEWAERIAAHRRRRPAGWRTVETTDLVPLLRAPGPPLLIDCMGLWLTAHLDDPGLPERVGELVEAWRDTPRRVVMVTNEVGSGVVPPTQAGRRFRDELGRLNAALAAEADEVWHVVAGIPTRLPHGLPG